MAQRPQGTFVSLSESDKEQLRRLIAGGLSLRAAVQEVGCNYQHAYFFAHCEQLIPYCPRGHDTQALAAGIELVSKGVRVHTAARQVGVSDPVLRRQAYKLGLCVPVSQQQRRINATWQRVIFLRLRLASLSTRDAAVACGISFRKAWDFDKGVVQSAQTRSQVFVPSGPAAGVYNKLMKRLHKLNARPAEAMQPLPKLAAGVDPYKKINKRYLDHDERIHIADWRREGVSIRKIARRLGRCHSTISRELRRNHSPQGPYHAGAAQIRAVARRARPQIGKLLANPRLRDWVIDKLRAQWSPEEIQGRIRLDFLDDEDMRVSAETIYEAFYLEPKGRLKDLGLSLPSGRTKRRTRTSVREQSPRKRFVDEFCSIDQRPAEANDRAVPGHWEGDLIVGKENKSAVITLVERTTRFTVLGHLPGRHDAQSVLDSLKDTVQSLDQSMWSSITWDQGSEMAGHKAFTMATDIPIYLAHPGSPWERGSNENNNGRLRRNLPKSSDLSVHSKEDLEIIVNIHNHKPRKILGWKTPAEAMAETLRQAGSIT